jgi:hypothetical protein
MIAADWRSYGLESREARADWCYSQNPEVLVTIQFNEPLGEQQILAAAEQFRIQFHRYCMQKRWRKFPESERGFWMGTSTIGETGNAHMHLALRMPRDYWRKFQFQTESAPWKRALHMRFLSAHFTEIGRKRFICPHGTITFTQRDPRVIADYVFMRNFRTGSHLILSTECDPVNQQGNQYCDLHESQ